MTGDAAISADRARATTIGCAAVLIWGLALPVFRLTEQRIGVLAFISTIYAGGGALGLVKNRWQASHPSPAVVKSPYLYGRWLCFVGHDALMMTALFLVGKANVPFVILLNYLWPTAIILTSVLLGVVAVSRLGLFILGTGVVVGSLAVEILGSAGATVDLFAVPTDRLAYILAFLGAVSWGLYTTLGAKGGARSGGGAVIPYFQLTLALALPLTLWPGLAHWEQLTGPWPWLLGLFCLLQFLANLTWDLGARRGSLIVLSLLSDLIPWISLGAAKVLLGAPIGPATVFAAIALVAGAICIRLSTTRSV